jgi:hypothetical protein
MDSPKLVSLLSLPERSLSEDKSLHGPKDAFSSPTYATGNENIRVSVYKYGDRCSVTVCLVFHGKTVQNNLSIIT